MAHNEQRDFFLTVRKMFPHNFEGKWVLEVGSLNVNGTVRDFFTDCHYVGIDVGPGPGVDGVANGATVDFPTDKFDTTISAECFEHNPDWLETFLNMIRMTKPGGLLTFSCAGEGRPEHGTTRSDKGSSPLTVDLGWEHYRNLTPNDFTRILPMDFLFTEWKFSVNEKSCDTYFWGIVR